MTRDRLSFLFLNVGHAYDHLFMLIFPTVVLALQREWQASYSDLLALGTVGFVAFAAGTLPAGWLGDRWSRTGMMTVFFLGLGLSSVLTGLARSPFELALGLGLLGLFASIYHPVGTAMVVQGAARTGRALGINGVSGNLGVALAGVTAGALTDLISWRAAFILPGLLAVATGVAFALTAARRDQAAGGLAAAKPQAAPDLSRGDQIRVLAVVAVAALFGGLVFTALTVALPKIFEERLADLATSTTGVGAFVSVVFAVAALAQIPVGYLLDRYPVKRLFLLLLAAQLVLLPLAVGAEGIGMLLVAVPLMLVVFGEIPITDWLVGRYAAAAWRSRVYAVKYVLSLGVGAMGVPMVAFLHESAGGFATLFLVLAVLVAGIAAAVPLLPGRRRAAAGTVPAEPPLEPAP